MKQPGQTASGGALHGGAMLGYLAALSLVAAVVLILGLVALVRCHREDIPAIMSALASWWRR